MARVTIENRLSIKISSKKTLKKNKLKIVPLRILSYRKRS